MRSIGIADRTKRIGIRRSLRENAHRIAVGAVTQTSVTRGLHRLPTDAHRHFASRIGVARQLRKVIGRVHEDILPKTGRGTHLVLRLSKIREEDIRHLAEVLIRTVGIRSAGIIGMPYVKELTVRVLQHDLMLPVRGTEHKTNRYMQFEVRSLRQVLLVLVISPAGGGTERVRAGEVDIRIHVIIREITQVVGIIRHAFVRQTQAHLKPPAGMQVEVNPRLPVRGYLTLAMPEQQTVQREVQMGMQVQLATDGVVGIETERIL